MADSTAILHLDQPQIVAYRLKSDTMGGSEWGHRVYLDRAVALMTAEAKKKEWENYHVHEVKVRVLSDTEGAVGRDVVDIDRTTVTDLHRQRGLAKLTKEEREALEL